MQTVPTIDFLILLSFMVEICPYQAISSSQQDIPTGGLKRCKQLLLLSSYERLQHWGNSKVGLGGFKKGEVGSNKQRRSQVLGI